MADEKKAQSKTRNWATILYPESCADNWRDIVAGWKIPALASPVHDRDVDKDGKLKKPHIHLIMMFPGAKTRSCVQKLTEPLGAVGLEAVQSVRGMARYLTHMDDKDKAQYDRKDVKPFGGADYDSLIMSDGKEGDIEAMCAIMEWCDEKQCFSFAQLMRYARRERKEWLKVLCSSKHAVIYRYLRSCEWEAGLEQAQEWKKLESDSPERGESLDEKGDALSDFPRNQYLHGDGQTELRAVADAAPPPSTPWDRQPQGKPGCGGKCIGARAHALAMAEAIRNNADVDLSELRDRHFYG